MKTIKQSTQRTAQLLRELDSVQSISEEWLWKIVDVLSCPDDFDVAYCAWAADGTSVHGYGMDIIRAFEVFYQACGFELFGQRRQVSRRTEQYQEMDDLLKKLVSSLQQRSELTFCLAWRFRGEHAEALHHSADLCWKDAKRAMLDYLTSELAELLDLWEPGDVPGADSCLGTRPVEPAAF